MTPAVRKQDDVIARGVMKFDVGLFHWSLGCLVGLAGLEPPLVSWELFEPLIKQLYFLCLSDLIGNSSGTEANKQSGQLGKSSCLWCFPLERSRPSHTAKL